MSFPEPENIANPIPENSLQGKHRSSGPLPEEHIGSWHYPELQHPPVNPLVPTKEKKAKGPVFISLSSAVIASLLTATFMTYATPGVTTIEQKTIAVQDAGVVTNTATVASSLASIFTIAVTSDTSNGTGSGVAIDATHIVTNSHVVNLGGQAGANIKFEVQDSNGKAYTATLVGDDPVADVAVLKVEKASFAPITWGDSEALVVGQGVIALGAPLGLADTVTSGIVSAVNRPVSLTETANGQDTTVYINALQTDAAINSGNSGGALLNSDGELVGLNVAITSTGDNTGSIGIGYAIPSNYVKRIAEEIISSGEGSHGLLGISATTLASAGGSFENGARISAVSADSPAVKAGLKVGDIITRWNAYQVASSASLTAYAKSEKPGSKITITYRRNGITKTTVVTLASAS